MAKQNYNNQRGRSDRKKRPSKGNVFYEYDKFNYKDFKTQTEHRLFDELLQFKQSNKLNIILDAISTFVEHKAKKEVITSTQLRNMYSEIIKMKDFTELQLFRPRLAYIAGRNGKSREMIMFFDNLAGKVANNTQLKNYQVFMEALVSYQKFFHGES